MLTSAAREVLRSVRTVIVDEVHALAGTKRGAHLAVSLERLEALAAESSAAELPRRPIQRIGLSATVRPPERVAAYLGGAHPVRIVAPPAEKSWDLSIVVPVEDMSDLGASASTPSRASTLEDEQAPPRTPSIWPHVENKILDLISEHRSTIVFANSRRLAERLTAHLNELQAERLGEPTEEFPPPAQVMAQSGASTGRDGSGSPIIARAHHGSVSKEQRAQIEEDLKSGQLPCVVATSSLELGIDMGAVDVVVQVEAPPSVASGLQRVGRAGHQVGATSRGIFFPNHRGDLIESAVVVERMRQGAIEEVSELQESAGRARPADRRGGCGRGDQGRRAVRPGPPGQQLPRPAPQRVRGGARHAQRPLSVGGLRRAPTAAGLAPGHRRADRASGSPATGRHLRRDHPRPRTVRGLPGRRRQCVRQARARPAGRRAGRGDGLRDAGGRRVHPRDDELAGRADHPRSGPGLPGTGSARPVAVLEGRRARPTAGAGPRLRRVRP